MQGQKLRLIRPKRKSSNEVCSCRVSTIWDKICFSSEARAIVRGIPTTHSALPLNNEIQSNEKYVWAYAKGNTRGQSIEPLYPSVPEAVLKDEKLYELLAITDAIRVGRTREKN